MAFGASALALDKAFEVAEVKEDPTSDNNVVRLRTLVYLVRCAYAHGIADPKWEVRGKYNTSLILNLPSGATNIDLRELDGQSFNFEQLGGHGIWF